MSNWFDRFNSKMESVWQGARILARTVPGPVVATYVLALCYMNFFAIKEFPLGDIAVIDCAFLLSWIPFIITDVMIKFLDFHAAVSLAVFGASCNAVFSLLLWLVARIPSSFGLPNIPGIDRALSEILGGHILIILGSCIALILSTLVKGYCIKWLDTKLEDPLSVRTVYIEAFISSGIGQLVDNFIFAFFSAFLLFHWNIPIIILSILIKTVIELFMEMTCLPIGYISIIHFREDKIGKKYAKFIEKEKFKNFKN